MIKERIELRRAVRYLESPYLRSAVNIILPRGKESVGITSLRQTVWFIVLLQRLGLSATSTPRPVSEAAAAHLLNDAQLQRMPTSCSSVSKDLRANLQDLWNVLASRLRQNLGLWRSCSHIHCGLHVASGALLKPCRLLKTPAQSHFLLGESAGAAAQPVFTYNGLKLLPSRQVYDIDTAFLSDDFSRGESDFPPRARQNSYGRICSLFRCIDESPTEQTRASFRFFYSLFR